MRTFSRISKKMWFLIAALGIYLFVKYIFVGPGCAYLEHVRTIGSNATALQKAADRFWRITGDRYPSTEKELELCFSGSDKERKNPISENGNWYQLMDAADLSSAIMNTRRAKPGEVVYIPVRQNGLIQTYYVLSLDENGRVLGVDVSKSAQRYWVRTAIQSAK